MFEKLMERNVTAWPAWGELDVSAYQQLAQYPGAPPDWDHAETWDEFVKAMLDLIGSTLWQEFDSQKCEFPASTLARRQKLTAADLTLMMAMQSEVPEHFQQPIQTPVSGPAPSTHLAYFLLEDQSTVGTIYYEYDATLPQALVAQVGPAMRDGYNSKVVSAPKQFKRVLQRPRAYQMVKPYGIANFRHQPANTAQSPSMVSGHCLEGLIMVGSVIDQWLKDGVALNDESWQALEQYAVDIGDRRVMAGVHYPSDNISSWMVAMRMADHVFKNATTVKRHLWDAITRRSFVYKRIAGCEHDVYEEALQALQKLKP